MISLEYDNTKNYWPVKEVTSENYDDPELHSAPEIGSFCVAIYESLYLFNNYVCFHLGEVELSAQGDMGNEYTASVDGEIVILVGETLRKVLEELPGDVRGCLLRLGAMEGRG